MISLINGKIKNKISILDRGLNFGDGCFTTIRILKNKVSFLQDHILRLKECVKVLHLSDPNWKEVINDIKKLANLNTQDIAVIKVIFTRGKSNNIGYGINFISKTQVIILLLNYPVFYFQKQQTGIDLVLSKIPVNNNPYLSKIKHLNRLEQILIRREVDLLGVDEAITFDSNKILKGCCSSNIFLRKGNKIYIPDLSKSGISGVMSKKIVSYLSKINYDFFYIKTNFDFLFSCDEIFITNSLMPILSVNRVFLNSKKNFINFSSRKLYDFLLPYFLKCS